MANQYKNKVIYGDQTLMDITDTTATENEVLEGEVFYTASGARGVGTLGDATTTTHGLMSASDKVKLDGIDLLGIKLNSTALTPDANGYVSIPLMTGATSSVDGTAGLIPAPTSADREKFFRGDGAWTTVYATEIPMSTTDPTKVDVAIGNKIDKVPTATSGDIATLDSNGNLTDSGKKTTDFMEEMTILSYGNSTWNDFITAYSKNRVIYCRASSNSNPKTGSQNRLAFMAYLNNATSPTEVEFQYYRSVSSHSASQQGDQVFVYKLTSAGAWTVTVREAMSKIVAGTNMSSSYSSGTLTLSATDTTYSDMTGASSSAAGAHGLVPAPSAGDEEKVLKGDGTWGEVDALPSVTSSDNGKVLGVSNGAWAVDDSKAPKASPVFTGSISLGRTGNTGTGSIAIGSDAEASGNYSFAHGLMVAASGAESSAQGFMAYATGIYAHAEGCNTRAFGDAAHAENIGTYATGDNSHASGNATKATHKNQFVFGECNVEDPSTAQASAKGTYIEIVGNGTLGATSIYSNARSLDWDGNERLNGDLYVNCNDDSSGGTKVIATDFVGATSSTAGTHGLVPAPAAGNDSLVLTAGGTWEESPGAKVYVKTVTVTNVSGAYSQTFSDENITASMKAIELEVNRAYVFGDLITVTPADGSVTVSCPDVAGTDTIKIALIKVIDDPTAVTSTEFDILANRIGDLDDLTTTSKTNVVAAINEVDARIANSIKTISSGSLHDIKTSGLYYITGSVTDKPTGNGGYYSVTAYNSNLLVGVFSNTDGVSYNVVYSNGVWYTNRIANYSSIAKIEDLEELGTVSNLNIASRVAGKCYHMTYGGTATGNPYSSTGGHSILYVNGDNANYGSQVALSNGGCYFRVLSNGSYWAWDKMSSSIKYATYMIPAKITIAAHSSANIGSTSTIFSLPSGSTVLAVLTGLDGSNNGLCFGQASNNGNTYIYNAGTNSTDIQTSTKLTCLYI